MRLWVFTEFIKQEAVFPKASVTIRPLFEMKGVAPCWTLEILQVYGASALTSPLRFLMPASIVCQQCILHHLFYPPV